MKIEKNTIFCVLIKKIAKFLHNIDFLIDKVKRGLYNDHSMTLLTDKKAEITAVECCVFIADRLGELVFSIKSVRPFLTP